jgi:CubicO group peptidase (beta-lactamase class C family)
MRISRCVPAVLFAAFCAANATAANPVYYPPPDAAGGWRTLKDPAQVRKIAGIDVKRLDQAFQYAQRTSQHGGLLVVRHGWLVYEKYYGKCWRDSTPSAASVGKTFTSASCGIMLDEFKAQLPDGLETKVFTAKYLPDALPLSDPRKADIKLGQLLAMTSGLQDGSGGTGFVKGEDVKVAASPGAGRGGGADLQALRAPLWTEPGGGYFYSNLGAHVLSILVHKITGKTMEDYIREKLAGPMGWGPWGYPPPANAAAPPANTPGAGGIAVRATDMLRFAYLLLHQGNWQGRQLIPSGYVALCSKPSPYDPHAPYSLQFTVNADGQLAAPRDAFFKSGAGGFGIYIVPSLDMVVWKIAGNERQYAWTAPGLPQNTGYNGSRDQWQPHQGDQFHDPPIDVDTGVRRTLEMVAAAAVDR